MITFDNFYITSEIFKMNLKKFIQIFIFNTSKKSTKYKYYNLNGFLCFV